MTDGVANVANVANKAAGERGTGGSDPSLEMLLELWDRLDEDAGQPNTLGMTVVVEGTPYSGLLIAGRVWARTLGNYIRNTPENRQLAALGVFFDGMVDSYEKAGDASDARSYLHLANVAVGLPGETTATIRSEAAAGFEAVSRGQRTSLLLRFRTSDVSAWTIGTIGELPPFLIPAAPPPAG